MQRQESIMNERTKMAMFDSFNKLLVKVNLEKITVQMIVDGAEGSKTY